MLHCSITFHHTYINTHTRTHTHTHIERERERERGGGGEADKKRLYADSISLGKK